MSITQAPNQPLKSLQNWPVYVQLVFSVLAAILLLGVAFFIAVTSIIQYSTHPFPNNDPTQSLMVAASLAFAGMLVLPSAWYAWKHIANHGLESASPTKRRGFGLILTIIVLVVTGGALLLGNWSAQNNRFTWLLLPPLNIIATGLPAMWMVYIGTRGLLPDPPRRKWGVFATGLVLGPFVILILELLLLIGMGILALLWIMVNPDLASQLNGLSFRLQNAAPDPQAILNVLLPFLLNPVVLLIGFAFIAVLVPLIEETLKPIGVWFLAGQNITPAQGFGFGVLSGAGFGLFENLGNTSGGGAAWALVTASRISTVMLHCFTAGLVGWALVSAWRQRRFWRLGFTYAIAVFVHGIWNGMAVLSAAVSLQSLTNISIPNNLQRIGTLSTDGIFILGTLVLLIYISFNTVLRRTLPAQIPSAPGEGQSLDAAGGPTLSIPPDVPTQSPQEARSTVLTSPGDNSPSQANSAEHLEAGENTHSAPDTTL